MWVSNEGIHDMNEHLVIIPRTSFINCTQHLKKRQVIEDSEVLVNCKNITSEILMYFYMKINCRVYYYYDIEFCFLSTRFVTYNTMSNQAFSNDLAKIFCLFEDNVPVNIRIPK
jgi:sulfur relay (sulfurtransferase) DsrF/TusC family protein